MSLPRPSPVSPLAEALDLTAAWTATDDDVAARFHPQYGPALSHLPDGAVVFRGLPFALGQRSSGRRWLLLDEPITVRLPQRRDRVVSHLVLAHFADSARNERGERPPETPVGWVLPAGEPLARYHVELANRSRRTLVVRRRFEIADGIIGWGFLPFEAVGHRSDEALDWRGPYPRQSPGRYPAAGQAGLLGMLPGSWGPTQTAVADFVPTADDDITYWLHALAIPPGEEPEAITLEPVDGGQPGSAVVVAGITVFHGTTNPLALRPRRQVRIDGVAAGGPVTLPGVDLGLAIRGRSAEPRAAADGVLASQARDSDLPIGWGRPRWGTAVLANDPESRANDEAGGSETLIVDLVAAQDARLYIDEGEIPISALESGAAVSVGETVITALKPPIVRVAVHVRVDGAATASRLRFVTDDGRYVAPLGHRDEVNPALLEDTGADILLGSDAYAYVAGDVEIDLPVGGVEIEVCKGFEHRPIRTHLEVDSATRDLTIELDRTIDLAGSGWRSADPHVHFLAPSTALVQAAAEDVGLVHLLATQAGDLVTNAQDLAWGSVADPSGRHTVIVGTENRQNLLGHLTLLGARTPVLPMAAGGAPEGRLGGAVDELLSDWADRCHRTGGIVVAAHFPLPYAEIAAAIVMGRIDAVELQTFSPRLDTPSILEWYRFLNCGYRLPVLGGTDKMSAEVPVGAIRTYARLDREAPLTADTWATAVRAGRTFATSGPILELAVDGHEPGDVIGMTSSGGVVDVRARARAAQPVIDAVEVVLNGEVVGRETARSSTEVLEVTATVDVRRSGWIVARSRSKDEIRSAFATAMAAHTSPVYIEVADRPLASADDAEAIATVIDGTARWLETMAAIDDPTVRSRMVAEIETAAAAVRRRSGGGRRD